jgi:hypothetical protein
MNEQSVPRAHSSPNEWAVIFTPTGQQNIANQPRFGRESAVCHFLRAVAGRKFRFGPAPDGLQEGAPVAFPHEWMEPRYGGGSGCFLIVLAADDSQQTGKKMNGRPTVSRLVWSQLTAVISIQTHIPPNRKQRQKIRR